jgi:TPR repeat protein
MFSLGRIAYIEGDFSESHRWFSRAAEAGHVRSLYWIGKHHWYGQHVPRDKKEAMKFFHLAAGKKVVAARRVLKFLSRRHHDKSTA